MFIKIRLLFFLFVILTTKSFGQEILDKAEFTSKFCEYLKIKFHNASVEYIKELEVKYKIGEKEAIIAYLDNAYSEYKLEPSEINSVFEKHIGWLNDKEEKKKENIVPIIKGTSFFNGMKELDYSKDLYFEKINEELFVYYAFDNENSISFIENADLDKMNISRKEIRNLAITNLDRFISQIERKGSDGSFMIIAGGMYEASLILLTDIWTKENFPVKGDFVIAIPARDLLFVTGTREEKSLQMIKKEYLSDDKEFSYFITKKMFILKNGSWKVYK